MTSTTLALDVALTPAFVTAETEARQRTTFIVVDVIRATTTLTVLFERGCRRVLVAPGVAEARAYRNANLPDALLAGESGGVAPPGYDVGNSPAEMEHAHVADRDVVFATTNGTRALRACAGGRAIYAGSLRNTAAVCAAAFASALRMSERNREEGELAPRESVPNGASEAALEVRTPDIVIVCSGRGDRPAYDDTLCAGYLASELIRLAQAHGTPVALSEGARIALAATQYVLHNVELRAALAVSDAARATERVGLSGDLDWCAAIDASDAVPAVVGITPEGLLLVERQTPA